MYEAYYGFEEKPFALSPDPKYLFLSATHREVLGHLLYGIEQGEGFMAISGEVGTGKTTLCRTLLDRLAGSCEIAFLFNPTLGPTDLIKAINAEFGLSTFGDSRPELLDVLNTFLLEQNAEGRRVLVIIDEAQNLPIDTLEQLRLLSNLESRTQKLLQIVLIGQPELDEILAAREMRQLRQRISVWWKLGPLEPAETRAYVRHRLRLATGANRPLFTDGALAQVHRTTGGVPQLVNVLCDRSLLAGFGEQTPQITARIVRQVAREIRLGRVVSRRREWAAAVTGIAALALAALVWSQWPRDLGPLATPPHVAAAAPPLPGSTLASLPTAPPSAPLVPPTQAERERLGDDLLDNLLSLNEPGISNGHALTALLDAWRLPRDGPRELGFAQLLSALETRGLRVLRVLSADELARIDVPGLIQLRAADGRLHAAVVRHVDEGNAQLEGLLPGQLVRVPLPVLEARWAGPGYAAWRDFEGLPPILHDGRFGPEVAFVQRSLAKLGLYNGEVHGSFDEATRDAVMVFQAFAGLPVDGNVGPATQVRLYHALPDYRMPVLAFRQ